MIVSGDAANRLKTATGKTVDYVQTNKHNGYGQRVEKSEIVGTVTLSYNYDTFGETTEYQQDENDPFYNEICYTAGTKISTENGFTLIEQIKPGDYVWSENPETNEKALKKVNKIFVREKDSIVRLSINGEIIETTDEHPFYVEGKGFVAAAALSYGDEVRLQNGDTAVVDDIEEIQLDEPIKVYNFEVEDFHTYYVSEQEVLVHNTCAMEVPQSGDTAIKPNYVKKVKSRDGQPPQNFSPVGAGRKGAFNEAKRASGIPTSQNPIEVVPARDKNGNLIPGRDYIFNSPKPDDPQNMIVVREHFGHNYPDNPLQNRGNHFNDIHGNHYDY